MGVNEFKCLQLNDREQGGEGVIDLGTKPRKWFKKFFFNDPGSEYDLAGMSPDIRHTPSGYLRRTKKGELEEVSNYTGCIISDTWRYLIDGTTERTYTALLVADNGIQVLIDVPGEEWGTSGMMERIAKRAGPFFRTRLGARELGNVLLDDGSGKFERFDIYDGFGFVSSGVFRAPSGSILKGGGCLPNLVVKPVEELHARHLDLLLPVRKNEPGKLAKVVLNDLVALQDRAVTLPLLGAVGLAVIHRFLPVTTYPTIACIGPSGTGKTSLCRAIQCFFGPFPVDGNLMTFSATPNSLERAMYLFADSVLAIDDMKRSTIDGNRAGYRRLIQNASDRTGRARLNGAGTSQVVNTPRCIAILTGEDMLGDEPATVARQIILPFESTRRKPARMRRVLELAPRFSVLTRVFVEYIQRFEDAAEIAATFRDYENLIVKLLDPDPNRERIASHVAQVATGLHYLLDSWSDAELIPEADADSLFEEGFEALEIRAVEQLNLVHEEDVVAVFVQCLRDLIDTGQVRVARPQDRHGVSNLIGFDLGDDDPLNYLIPDLAYRAVDHHFRRLGKALGLSQRSLTKALRERGFTVCNHGNFYEKRLPGMAKRSYLALPKTVE